MKSPAISVHRTRRRSSWRLNTQRPVPPTSCACSPLRPLSWKPWWIRCGLCKNNNVECRSGPVFKEGVPASNQEVSKVSRIACYVGVKYLSSAHIPCLALCFRRPLRRPDAAPLALANVSSSSHPRPRLGSWIRLHTQRPFLPCNISPVNARSLPECLSACHAGPARFAENTWGPGHF